MDLRQSPQYAHFLESLGWQIEKISTSKKSAFVYLRKLPGLPIGVCKVQRFEGLLDFEQLKKLEKKHHVFYTIIEPLELDNVDVYPQRGYRLSKSPYLPTKTRVINLTTSVTTLKRNLSANYRRILNKPTPIEIVSPDPEQFFRSFQQYARLWPPSKKEYEALLKAFGSNIKLLASSKDGELLSGIVLLLTPHEAYYYQTWTSPKGRLINAHHHLVWQTLLTLKKQHFRYFDFEGVNDERFPRKSWLGFSDFKLKFGGETKVFPGSFQGWRIPC